MEPKMAGRVSGHPPASKSAQAGLATCNETSPHGAQDFLTLEGAGPDTWSAQGVLIGTPVLSMEGELPVEHLCVGDRIITRDSGTAVLRSIRALRYEGPCIRIAQNALGHRRPGEDTDLLPGQKVLIRDWRAQALYGTKSAMVPASQLVDGQFVTETARKPRIAFMLLFDAPHVIYAGGLELGIEPQLEAASRPMARST